MDYFDSHCHLNDADLSCRADEVYQNAMSAGVTSMLVIGWDLESSRNAIRLAEQHPGLYAAIGFHPENLETVSDEALDEIRRLAVSPKVKAIGEIGLDYHWFKDPKDHENQKVWLIKQIELANELGLPASIHAREATADIYEIFKTHPLKAGGVLHCYSGSVEMLREFARLGFYFGFDGPITYKNAVTPKECVAACPLDRLLVETDSPYLTPVPFRGKQNEPQYIPYIVKAIAEIKGTDEETLKEQLWANYEKLFRVKHE